MSKLDGQSSGLVRQVHADPGAGRNVKGADAGVLVGAELEVECIWLPRVDAKVVAVGADRGVGCLRVPDRDIVELDGSDVVDQHLIGADAFQKLD